MGQSSIVIKGAREHNLKNVDVEIPRDKLVVITGLSGSGKSSLAFDTIYAEGQRRYVESLSSYARQFLGQMTSIPSTAFLLRFPSIRRQRAKTPDPRLVPLRKSTIICAFFSRAWASLIVLSAVARSSRKPLIKLPTMCWH